MPSFDAVSKIDAHELTNAVDQANRELSQRFDFKGMACKFVLREKDFTVEVRGEVEFHLKQMLDILKLKLTKRGIDIGCLDIKDVQANLAEARQDIVLRHGIDPDCGKKIVKLIKESKLKVQAGIHGDKVRISGKQRDDLQAAIALLRNEKFDRPLSYDNFRD
ncbi:MAG: YajQ family cyclic di-GMP-binding protein [Gammaproteobacteria bacterium]|nr:YajQ family cyclic di-GMP-binding protein [Gammaproteobacteria bacterium]